MCRKYTIEKVRQMLFEKDIKLITNIYKNNKQKIQLKCLKSGILFCSNLDRIINRNCCCKECASEKRKRTWIKNLGVDNPTKNKKIVEKRRQNCMKKYGKIHPMQLEDIQIKSQQTCLEKYGVEHPCQNKEIATKCARNQSKSILINCWDGRQLICQSSYEKHFIENYINLNKYHIDWQISFLMSNGKKYYVDCYIKELNLYIEIKGYFRKDALEKWEWFHKEHPNSELWDKKKLQELKII